MGLNQEKSADMGVDKVRADAVNHADRLLMQLQADHADLTQWPERRHRTAIQIAPGLSALAQVVQATERVRAELRHG